MDFSRLSDLYRSFIWVSLFTIALLLALAGWLGWYLHGETETKTIQDLRDELAQLHDRFDMATDDKINAETWLIEINQQMANSELEKRTLLKLYTDSLKVYKFFLGDADRLRMLKYYHFQSSRPAFVQRE